MLFLSEDKSRFICTDTNGRVCFIRGEHLTEAKTLNIDLYKIENKTIDFHYDGKGQSIKEYLK